MRYFYVFLLVNFFIAESSSQQITAGVQMGFSKEFPNLVRSCKTEDCSFKSNAEFGLLFSFLLRARTLKSNYVNLKYTYRIPASSGIQYVDKSSVGYLFPSTHAIGIGYDFRIFKKYIKSNELFLTTNMDVVFVKPAQFSFSLNPTLGISKYNFINPNYFLIEPGLRYVFKRNKINFGFFTSMSVGLIYSNILSLNAMDDEVLAKFKGDAFNIGIVLLLDERKR